VGGLQAVQGGLGCLSLKTYSPCPQFILPFSLSLSRSRFHFLTLSLSLSLSLRTLPLEFDLPVTVCDITELDFSEDADTWYADVNFQLKTSAPLTDEYHYKFDRYDLFICTRDEKELKTSSAPGKESTPRCLQLGVF
jgi:hypothetical protein